MRNESLQFYYTTSKENNGAFHFHCILLFHVSNDRYEQ